MRVRCPHCHSPIELSGASSLSDIPCPACGSSFSLIGEDETAAYQAGTRTVGRFELIEQIGAGTFGAVWKARDIDLDRVVAIKIPRKGQLDPDETEQFLREARAAAQLTHPNIVSVHEVGRQEDTVYIVSDFVEGVTLGDRLSAQRFSVREAAELCAGIADALHHAHEAKVIHRDLKPANILLDAAGTPHIMDFGLARREAGEVTMTVEGRTLGTPAYMSPEQARGSAHTADRRSDIYSLGVILFELLTGERPFRGSVRMLLHQVINDEPPSPRKLASSVPKDLETICLKCLEKDPEKRYSTAQELADELRRFLAGETIRARPISMVARGWRWCKRRPAVAGLLATVVLLLAVGAAISSYYAIVADRQAESAMQLAAREAATRKRAQEEAEAKRRQLYISDMQVAQQAWETGHARHVVQLLRRHDSHDSPNDSRGFEWYYLWRECQSQKSLTVEHFEDVPIRASFAGNGDNGVVALGYAGGAVRLLTLRNGVTESVRTLKEDDGKWYRTFASISPDTEQIAYPSAKPDVLLGHTGPVYAVKFSTDGKTLFSGGGPDHTIKLWDVATRQLRFTLTDTGRNEYFAVSKDGRTLASGAETSIRLWRAASPEEVQAAGNWW